MHPNSECHRSYDTDEHRRSLPGLHADPMLPESREHLRPNAPTRTDTSASSPKTPIHSSMMLRNPFKNTSQWLVGLTAASNAVGMRVPPLLEQDLEQLVLNDILRIERRSVPNQDIQSTRFIPHHTVPPQHVLPGDTTPCRERLLIHEIEKIRPGKQRRNTTPPISRIPRFR